MVEVMANILLAAPIESDLVAIGGEGRPPFPSWEAGEGNQLHRRQRWFSCSTGHVEPKYPANGQQQNDGQPDQPARPLQPPGKATCLWRDIRHAGACHSDTLRHLPQMLDQLLY